MMKFIKAHEILVTTTLCVAVALSATVYAATTAKKEAAKPTAESLQREAEACTTLGEFAGSIMESRQVGIPLSKMLEAVAEGGKDTLSRSLILAAYDTPRYNGATYRQRAIDEFRNDIEIRCYKTGR